MSSSSGLAVNRWLEINERRGREMSTAWLIGWYGGMGLFILCLIALGAAWFRGHR